MLVILKSLFAPVAMEEKLNAETEDKNIVIVVIIFAVLILLNELDVNCILAGAVVGLSVSWLTVDDGDATRDGSYSHVLYKSSAGSKKNDADVLTMMSSSVGVKREEALRPALS